MYAKQNGSQDFIGGVDLVGEGTKIETVGANTLKIVGFDADAHDHSKARKLRTLFLRAPTNLVKKGLTPKFSEWVETLTKNREALTLAMLRGEAVTDGSDAPEMHAVAEGDEETELTDGDVGAGEEIAEEVVQEVAEVPAAMEMEESAVTADASLFEAMIAAPSAGPLPPIGATVVSVAMSPTPPPTPSMPARPPTPPTPSTPLTPPPEPSMPPPSPEPARPTTPLTPPSGAPRVLLPLHASEIGSLRALKAALREANVGDLIDAMSSRGTVDEIADGVVSRAIFVTVVSSIGAAPETERAAHLLFDTVAASAGLSRAPDSLAIAQIVAAFSVASATDAALVSKQVFAAYDAASTGSLTLAELSAYLEVALAYRLLDRAPPRDERDSADAHAAAHAKHAARSSALAEALARRTFDEIDQDHSGGISPLEFQGWLESLNGRKAKTEAPQELSAAASASYGLASPPQTKVSVRQQAKLIDSGARPVHGKYTTAPEGTVRPALRKRLSVSVAPKRLSVNPFVIAVRPALRDTRRVVVAKEGALGIELMARYDERSTCIVVEVVKVKEGSQMEALGVRVGDWVERVHDVSIDLMNEADLDGDGKISIQELQTLLNGIRSVAPTEAYEDELIYPSAEVLMKRYDLEGDQTLTPGELTELVNHELLSAIVRLITTTARPFEVVCTTLERSVAVAANGAAAAALDAASGAVKAAGLSATNAEGHVNSAKLLNVTRQAKSGALFRPGKKVRGNRRGSAMLGQATHSAHHIEGMLHKKGNGALGRYQARFFSTSGRTC